jgi:hypothetical protein
MWFDGGLMSLDVPVILVTDAQLRSMQTTDYSSETAVSYLSIFAESVLLMGPEHGWMGGGLRPWMQLSHPSYLDKDVLDPLHAAGALPNASTGPKGKLTSLPGTWQQLSTSGLN